jgi:UDP-N-acetylglucosamine 2-epimerase (non-hydrolysing)
VRENTERPITVSEGTNRLVGTHPERIRAGIADALAMTGAPSTPDLWDGHTAERIADVYAAFLRA